MRGLLLSGVREGRFSEGVCLESLVVVEWERTAVGGSGEEEVTVASAPEATVGELGIFSSGCGLGWAGGDEVGLMLAFPALSVAYFAICSSGFGLCRASGGEWFTRETCFFKEREG